MVRKVEEFLVIKFIQRWARIQVGAIHTKLSQEHRKPGLDKFDVIVLELNTV